jgi:hypothetical protein
MPSSGMLRRVALVRTGVSEERSVSVIRVTRIGGLGTTLALTSNRRTLVSLMMEGLRSSKTLVLTRASRRNLPEDGILHSYRCENLKYYMFCECAPLDTFYLSIGEPNRFERK